MTPEQEKEFDELVRDLTSVVPRPKSEVRRRIQSLLSAQKKQLTEKLEGKKRFKSIPESCPDENPGCLVFHQRQVPDKEYNQAIQDAINLIEQYGAE